MKSALASPKPKTFRKSLPPRINRPIAWSWNTSTRPVSSAVLATQGRLLRIKSCHCAKPHPLPRSVFGDGCVRLSTSAFTSSHAPPRIPLTNHPQLSWATNCIIIVADEHPSLPFLRAPIKHSFFIAYLKVGSCFGGVFRLHKKGCITSMSHWSHGKEVLMMMIISHTMQEDNLCHVLCTTDKNVLVRRFSARVTDSRT